MNRSVGYTGPAAAFVLLGLAVVVPFACGEQSAKNPEQPPITPSSSVSRDSGPADHTDGSLTPSSGVDAGMLTDPGIWKPVENDLGCALTEARVAPDPFPKRVWSDCGSGCRVSNGALPILTTGGAGLGGSGGAYVNGDVYLSVELGFSAPALVQHITRLSDDATVAAVQTRGDPNHCTLSGTAADGPFLFTALGGTESAKRWTYGRASPTPGTAAIWQQASVVSPGYAVHHFIFDGALGTTFHNDLVGMLPAPTSLDYLIPDAGQQPIYGAAGRQDMLLLARFALDGGQVQRVAASGEVSTVAQLTNENPIAVAMDETRTAWIVAGGDAAKATSGEYERTSIAWATRSGATVGPIEPGPTLSSSPSAGYRTFQVAGDYAATLGCQIVSATNPDPACTLYVVRLSTKTTYVLNHRPGSNDFSAVLAVSPKEIVLAESDYPHHQPSGIIDRIVRIDVAALPALGW